MSKFCRPVGSDVGHNITCPRVQILDSKTGNAGLPSGGCDRDYLQQREVGQKAGVNLFNSVDKFHQVNVSLAQPVAYQVVLSMALEHLVNWRDQIMNTGTITRGPAPAQVSPAQLLASAAPLGRWGHQTTFTAPGSVRQRGARLCCSFLSLQLKHKLPVLIPVPTSLGSPRASSAGPGFCVPHALTTQTLCDVRTWRALHTVLSLSPLGKDSISTASFLNPEQTISESTLLLCLLSSFPGLSLWDLMNLGQRELTISLTASSLTANLHCFLICC